eukprot:Nitzschia sp. Nitz4//scaffold95_size97785//91069//92013//NITZ4_004682-RA/size97785-processed-gene-0.92-mRNA-1//-1//CDS//3329560517//6841//frame0
MTLQEPVALEDYKNATPDEQNETTTNVGDQSSLDVGQAAFPDVFYCPELGTVMKEPVLGPDGVSYEKSAVVPESPNDTSEMPKYYSNRALEAVIQEEQMIRSDSIRASLKSLHNTVSQSLSQILPESASNEPFLRPLNDAYYCPITFNLMHFPVTDPEGNTFEKVAIENWIRANGNSPITRSELSVSQLYPNNAIHTLLQNEKNKPVDEMHPSIRKWCDEAPPQATDVEMGGALADGDGAATGDNTNTTPYPLSVQQWQNREFEARRLRNHNIGVVLAVVSVVIFFYFNGNIFFYVMFLMSVMMILNNRQVHRR